MKRHKILAAALALTMSLPLPLLAAPNSPPKLVVMFIAEGVSAKQLYRFEDQYQGGLKQLLQEGARFQTAKHDYTDTETVVGQATLATGVYPNRHGLISTAWMDYETQKTVNASRDPAISSLGESGKEDGASPIQLKAPAFGDFLHQQSQGKSKVIVASLKDRSSVPAAGKSGVAYFLSAKTGRFITSKYYLKSYPDWWKRFYGSHPQNQWFGKKWYPLEPIKSYARSTLNNRSYHRNYKNMGSKFPHFLSRNLKKPDSTYYSILPRTPFGNDYLAAFTQALIEGENLGHNPSGATDFLVVSFSSLDLVSHLYSPASMQAQDTLLRFDRTLKTLIDFITDRVGKSNVAFVLTSDHGFGEAPDKWLEENLPSGQIDSTALKAKIKESLKEKYKYELSPFSTFRNHIYLKNAFLKETGADPVKVEEEIAQILQDYEGVETVVTRQQAMARSISDTPVHQALMRVWRPDSGPNVTIIPKMYWYFSTDFGEACATHISPYPYDTDVPLIFWGPWFQKGVIQTEVKAVDVAPTLMRLLQLNAPADAFDGRILDEVFV